MIRSPTVTDRLASLAQLTDSERASLWPALTEWELKARTYCAFCPYCCMDDLRHDRTPYGRHLWQQSWYTICRDHGIALVVRNLAHVPANRSYWSTVQLQTVADYAHADQYRSYEVVSEPAVRSNILACLVEIERRLIVMGTRHQSSVFVRGKNASLLLEPRITVIGHGPKRARRRRFSSNRSAGRYRQCVEQTEESGASCALYRHDRRYSFATLRRHRLTGDASACMSPIAHIAQPDPQTAA